MVVDFNNLSEKQRKAVQEIWSICTYLQFATTGKVVIGDDVLRGQCELIGGWMRTFESAEKTGGKS
jgi:hypothetical protein